MTGWMPPAPETDDERTGRQVNALMATMVRGGMREHMALITLPGGLEAYVRMYRPQKAEPTDPEAP